MHGLVFSFFLLGVLMGSDWSMSAANTADGYASSDTTSVTGMIFFYFLSFQVFCFFFIFLFLFCFFVSALIRDVSGGVTCFDVDLADTTFGSTIDSLNSASISVSIDSIVSSTDFSEDYASAEAVHSTVVSMTDGGYLTSSEASNYINEMVLSLTDAVANGTRIFESLSEVTAETSTLSSLLSFYEIVGVETVSNILSEYVPVVIENVHILLNESVDSQVEGLETLFELQRVLTFSEGCFTFGFVSDSDMNNNDKNENLVLSEIDEFATFVSYLGFLFSVSDDAFVWNYNDSYLVKNVFCGSGTCGTGQGIVCVESDLQTTSVIAVHATDIIDVTGQRRRLQSLESDSFEPVGPRYSVTLFGSNDVSSCGVEVNFEFNDEMIELNGVAYDDWNSGEFDMFPVCGVLNEASGVYEDEHCFVSSHNETSVTCVCNGVNATYQLYTMEAQFEVDKYVVWSYDPSKFSVLYFYVFFCFFLFFLFFF